MVVIKGDEFRSAGKDKGFPSSMPDPRRRRRLSAFNRTPPLPFALQPAEPVPDAVRRIVDEQLAKALEELRDVPPAKADAAVHSARKRFKRVRAVLRLVREELGEEVFAAENAHFRDAGASLGEARDAAVLVETLASLRGELDPEVYAGARRTLLARRRAVKRRVLDGGDGLASVAAAAQAARERLADWPLSADDFGALAPGLKRAYRDARQAFDRARPGEHADRFHDWRKRVKDLWHHCEVLQPIWPAVLKPLAAEFHELADLLGGDHDLAVLQDLCRADAMAHARQTSPVIDAAEFRRTALQRRARALGDKLFAERPKAFARRLGEYWQSWRAGDGPAPTTDARTPE
jgi:CHAD domain-containing protein